MSKIKIKKNNGGGMVASAHVNNLVKIELELELELEPEPK